MVHQQKRDNPRGYLSFVLADFLVRKNLAFAGEAKKSRFAFPPQSDGSLLTGGKARNIDAPRQNPRCKVLLHLGTNEKERRYREKGIFALKFYHFNFSEVEILRISSILCSFSIVVSSLGVPQYTSRSSANDFCSKSSEHLGALRTKNTEFCAL